MKSCAIISGGASGIGLACVSRLINDGWPIGVLDANSEAVAQASETFANENAMFLNCDVTDEDEVNACVGRLSDALGPVGAVINCAGIARDLPMMETPVELFRQILDVNVIGSFICARAGIEHMGDELAIVNITSASADRANKGRVAYGSSKACVDMMSKVMANELGSHNIRVNCVAPGPIDTPLIARLHTQDDRRLWTDRVPMGRYGEPVEIANAIAFLISDEASYINGHTLAVDGGFATAGILNES